MSLRRPVTTGALCLAAIASMAALPSPAVAEPTIWQITRDPKKAVESDALRKTEAYIRAAIRLDHGDVMRAIPADPEASLVQHKHAIPVLEEAGARTSDDPRLVIELAEELAAVRDYEGARKLAERALTLGDLGPEAERVYSLLAECHGRDHQLKDQVRYYDRALDNEPDAYGRSVLLANQAEGYLWMGNLERAIAGYRASLATMPTRFSIKSATTLWGLAVALDRSGDLSGAMDTIALAKQYDSPNVLRSSAWAFLPEYDADWYWALAALSEARQADDYALRLGQYDAAISHYEVFAMNAPKDNPYVEISKARMRQIEKERAVVKKRALDAELAKEAQHAKDPNRTKLDPPPEGPKLPPFPPAGPLPRPGRPTP